MSSVPVPAMVVTVPTWNSITINRNATISGSALVPQLANNAALVMQPYLADTAGNLLVPINGNGVGTSEPAGAIPTAPVYTNAVLDLSEIVTLADGVTKISILNRIDAIALAASTAI